MISIHLYLNKNRTIRFKAKLMMIITKEFNIIYKLMGKLKQEKPWKGSKIKDRLIIDYNY